MSQCTAKSKRSQTRCKKDAVVGTRVCHIHGGKSKKGLDHPDFVDGDRSKYFKRGRLREIYQGLESSGRFDPYAADHDLRLLITRQLDLLESGESRDLWKAVQDAWLKFKAAATGPDSATDEKKAAAREHFVTLDQFILAGAADSERWGEIYDVTERLDKIRDRGFKRLLSNEYLVRTDLAIALFAPLFIKLESLLVNYARQQKPVDAPLVEEIRAEWTRIMGTGNRQLISAGSPPHA